MGFIHKQIRQIVLELHDGGVYHVVRGGLETIVVALCYKVDQLLSTDLRFNYYRWRASRDVLDYNHPPCPFKSVRIDPTNIEYITGRSKPYLNRRLYFGKVMDGDWDKECDQIEEHFLYIAAKKHFKNGDAWENINEIQELVERVEHNRWGTKSFSDSDDVFESLTEFDKLYNTILDDGYLPQKELSTGKGRTSSLYPRELDEVAVDVGRNGDLLLADGKHRLIVAKLLEIDSIPAVIHVRHEMWMEYRDSIVERPVTKDHPDLQDL